MVARAALMDALMEKFAKSPQFEDNKGLKKCSKIRKAPVQRRLSEKID
jgi:hypothetical protein